MQRITPIILYLSLGVLQTQYILNVGISIEEVVLQVNREHNIEINIFVNINHEVQKLQMEDPLDQLAHQYHNLPKIIETNTSAVKQLRGAHSANSLTMVFITWENVNTTFLALDKLLHELHFTSIIFIYLNPYELERELMYIFHMCWNYGFTSVMVWSDQKLYTYHPYPKVEIKRVNNVSQFADKSHLENFHQFEWLQPTVEFPPRFYSYTNRYGQKVYSGYLYKLIYLFLTGHNASIEFFLFDMWSTNDSNQNLLQKCSVKRCALAPVLYNYHPTILASYCPYLAKGLFIVPSAKEIPESLYLIMPFDAPIWFIIIFCGFLFFILINGIATLRHSNYDFGHAFLDAFKIIMFLAVSSSMERSLKNFGLNLLFLFTGIFLTNYYVSSLWSLYTSKVYETELTLLADIERTNLKIFVYEPDLENFALLESLPPIISQRYYPGDKSLFHQYRKNLNMTYLYTGLEDLVDYIFLQQTFLKRPFAKKLSETFFHQPFIVAMVHRSPLYEQFNRYLSRIFEHGILSKFITDSYWEGIVGGEFKLLKDPAEQYVALNMTYFQYAFVILVFTWIGAFLVLLLELACHSS
uniref:Ionotropic glutamate receptor C-terminal domain-containing protein n=1 Tax=Stomoxys calcitrans TaxID=35570 RepID=A0A2Y9D4M2_STOCA